MTTAAGQQEGFRLSDGTGISAVATTTSSSLGVISVSLENNSNIVPAGSFYVAELLLPSSAGGTVEAGILSSSSVSPQSIYNALINPIPSYVPFSTVPASVLASNNIFTGTNQFNGNVFFASGSPWVDVRAFGAVGDGVTDDSTYFQDAHDALPTEGGTIYIPPPSVPGSFYNVTNWNVTKRGTRIMGAGRNVSRVASATGEVLNLATTSAGSDIAFLTIEGVKLWSKAGGGHTIKQLGHVSSMLMIDTYLQNDNSDKSLWENNAKLYIDNLVIGARCDMLVSSTTPGWHLVAPGGNINQNTWLGGRYTCSDSTNATPMFKIDATSASWQFMNHFKGLNFEVPIAGCIEARGVSGFSVEDCGVFDIGGSTTQADLFFVGQGNGGLESKGVRFVNVRRTSGNLGAGQNDIQFSTGVTDLYVGNCRHDGGSGFVIDFNKCVGNADLDNNITLNNSTNINRRLSGGKTLLGGSFGFAGSAAVTVAMTSEKLVLPIYDAGGTQLGVIGVSTGYT